MPYETGTASSPADLFTKLQTFAVTNGWAVTTLTVGKALSKGQMVVGMNTDANHWFTRPAIAVNAGAAWNAQTNASSWNHSCNLLTGPFTAYHFYSFTEEGKELLAVAVEISSGVFRHWIVCDLIKAGAYTGGVYSDSQYHRLDQNVTQQGGSGFHRYIADTDCNQPVDYGSVWNDGDGATNRWSAISIPSNWDPANQAIGSFRWQGKWGAMSHGIGAQPWNLRTPLYPIELFVKRAGVNYRAPLGRVPAMRQVYMKNFSPGEIITVGGVDWQVWPCVGRCDADGVYAGSIPSSAYYGYAYKR